MIDNIVEIFSNSSLKDLYTVLVTIGILFFIILAMYNRIKYLCLEKASEKIAAVEKMTELSGEEKFALVVTWINKDLPKIFRSSLMQNIIKAIINYAYNNSYEYAQNYIKRKTGYDISDVVNTIKKAEEDAKKEACAEEKNNLNDSK